MDDLAGLHAAHPEELLLRELWAEAVRNFFLVCRAAADSAGCSALLDLLYALYRQYPGEHRLGELQVECVELLNGPITEAVGQLANQTPPGPPRTTGNLVPKPD
jgi:hypothetical protein